MKIEVWVSKATFPLRRGETVEMFLRQLGRELRKKFEVRGTRANDWADEVWICQRAVQPGRVIFDRRGRGAEAGNIEGMYASEFTRDDTTTKFTFGDPVAVMMEKEFVPIQKSADFEKMEFESDWHGLGIG